MDLYHPSGEMSVRLMVLALLPGPLADAFGHNRFLRAWLAIRRNLGVAAFGYAVLHLAIYALDMQQLSAMLAELSIPGIWTGWFALLAMAIPAAISFDGPCAVWDAAEDFSDWCIPAALLSLIHWLLLDWAWGLRWFTSRRC